MKRHGSGGNLAIYYACFPHYLVMSWSRVHRAEFLQLCICEPPGWERQVLRLSCFALLGQQKNKFWQFNCWTSQVLFVICATSSFVGSMWASRSVLDLRLWRTSLSTALGSGPSCGACLLFYLDVVDT